MGGPGSGPTVSTPTATLKLRGSPLANNRPNEPKPKRCIPPPPQHLTKEEKADFRRFAKLLDGMGVMTAADAAMLARYCRMFTRWLDAERFIAENGTTYPKLDVTGKVIGFGEFPQVQQADRAATHLLKIEVQFGLSPASRPKLAAITRRGETPAHGNSAQHIYFKDREVV